MVMRRPQDFVVRRQWWSRRLTLAAFAIMVPLTPPAGAAEARLVAVQAIVPRADGFSPDYALTGAIQARIQSNISFRINGKVISRKVEVGQHVGPDDELAMLDTVEQQADVTNAEAALNAAKAQAQQAELTFQRQKTLIASGFTTRANFEQAQETLNTNQALVASAQASLTTAREQLSYASLKAGHAGIIVARNVEEGQVVQAGQTVFVLAQDGARDAVFDVPEALLTRPPVDKSVEVVLQSDPKIATRGTVREIAPIVDPATSTVNVKIGLDSAPPQMTLGATVIGRARWQPSAAVFLPWSALFESQGKPAVWVLNDADEVSLQLVDVQSYATGAVIISSAFKPQQRVVTAGVQLLYPGQKVAVVAGTAP
jgi:RND family efflux transporter MFP subunit